MLATLRSALSQPGTFDPARDARRAVLFGVIIVSVFVIGAGVWAASASLAGAVVAHGEVTVDLNRKTVQHREGGIVKQVLIRDGDRVAVGQPLIVLEDIAVDATVDLLRYELNAEHARAARLEAERALANQISFPDSLGVDKDDPRVAALLERERAVYATRRASLDGQIALLRQQIHHAKEDAEGLRDQLTAEAKALRLQREELAAGEALSRQNYVSKMRVLAQERAVAEYEARLGEHRSELAKTKQRISELELRILAQQDQYAQRANEELKEAASRINELEQRLRPSLDAAKRQSIVAPVAGEVVDLRFTSPGTVIGPRDPILDLVPINPRLIVKARIRTEDVINVRHDAAVDIRFTSFRYRTTPLVRGKVFYVSADRLVDPATNAPYYEVLIEVDRDSLRDAGRLALQPGMPAEVFVATEARTPLRYMLEPVTAFARRAFREP